MARRLAPTDTGAELDWRAETGSARWWAFRLSIVRGFAAYLQTFDPVTEVPPKDLLAGRPPRATPYLYADEEGH